MSLNLFNIHVKTLNFLFDLLLLDLIENVGFERLTNLSQVM